MTARRSSQHNDESDDVSRPSAEQDAADQDTHSAGDIPAVSETVDLTSIAALRGGVSGSNGAPLSTDRAGQSATENNLTGASGAESAEAGNDTTGSMPGPWRRLAQALSPQFQRGQLLGAALCALLGFALVVQVRHTQNTNDLTGLRGEELVRLLADLDAQSERLELERSALERDQEQLRNTSNLQGVAQRQAEERRQRLAVLAGTVPAFGPGVLISINDPQGQVSQRHLLSAVQELRGAGAEAIAVNNVRLVSSSSFAQHEGQVVVDGVKLSSPYVIQAIGSAETIGPALQMHGGVHATISQLVGADIDITEKSRVTISAVRDADGSVITQPDPGGATGSTPS